jgi:hypothetical protein
MRILQKYVYPRPYMSILVLLGILLNAQAQTAPRTAPSETRLADKSVATREDYDPLLDPPPLPHNRITLMGGTVTAVNEIENRITVRPFGAKQRMRLDFDVRTHIFRDGEAASERDLRAGQRVYLDTMLNGSRVFAKSIWIRTGAGYGNGRGQIEEYDSRANILTIKDEVSAQPVKFRLDSTTVIHDRSQTGSVSDLKPGTLVAVTFDPAQGGSGVVRELSLLATSGSSFTFLGRITFVDLSRKLIAVDNQSDGKNYDVYFESIPNSILQGLREGSQASISALFDGRRYVAQKIDLVPTGSGNTEEK